MFVKKNKKIYQIFIPVILLLAITCESIGYQVVASKEQIKSVYGLEGMERSQNVEMIENPLDMLQYSLEAVKDKDADKFIRGCAVLEQSYGIEFEEILEDQHDLIVEYVPSGNWLYYFPLMHADLTQKALEMYLSLEEMLEGLEWKEINYRNVDEQLSEEFIINMSRICDSWRATSLCEAVALFENDKGEKFQKTFLLVNYNGQWKMMINDINSMNNIEETTVDEYNMLLSGDLSIEKYEELYQIPDRKKIGTSELLPCNYFCFDERGEQTPEKLIEEFIYSIRKGEFEETLTYFYDGKTDQKSKIIKKGIRAKEITNLLYEVLGVSKDSKTKLESNFIEQMDPGNLIYLRENIKESVGDNLNKEISMVLRVNGKETAVRMGVINTSKGWMISSVEAE